MTPLACISKKRLGHKENQTKYRNMTRKAQSHVRILILIANVGYYGYEAKGIIENY